MVKKKVDPRVQGLIEYGVKSNHRSLFLLVGDHGKDQVENIHKILSKTRVKARPSVLWCYKKELGFSTHRKKRMKEIKKSQARGLYDPDRDDPFELFIASTNIRWTYYKESDKILGQTFGMCVLQDFEALTPNLLARTIETVEGGGIVIILLKTVKSLKQLYTLSMDVHSRFRTEAHHELVPRFNERFILSLGDCCGCLVLDDELNILPISSQVAHLPTYEDGRLNAAEVEVTSVEDLELLSLKQSLSDTPNVGYLIDLTKTIDQAKAVLSFLDAISERSLRSTVSLTAARGRGKSAAIGLCLAGAIAYGYSNVFVTAPSPENLKTVFEFIISGLKSLKYAEHLDFEIIQENHGDAGKVIVRVNIFRNHRQTIQYILPTEDSKLSQAELVAIDEAAAIPLPIVKKLMGSGSYLLFLSSTINGYEGTGRSLSLKLIQQLRQQQGASIAAAANQAGAVIAGSKAKRGSLHEERWKVSAEAAASYSASGTSSQGIRKLTELTLTVPIRYGSGDPVEKWLNNLLCLDVANNSTRMVNVMPAPKDCELYVVDRDALFSYHAMSESLLQRIWALYTAAHYKNSPNDLQMLSDAPAHRLFVLLGPQKSQHHSSSGKPVLPDVLCVVQIAFEGLISQKSIQSELAKGNKASGDLIPWTISQQFNDTEFATLSGARVVRIATHPDVQKIGYGSRAIEILSSYFQGELTVETIPPTRGMFGGEGIGIAADDNGDERSTAGLLSEEITPRKKLPPLLTNIADRPAERLHWFGTSFGLTSQLLNFWSRQKFQICYLRQTCNELTGEYSAIVLKELNCLDLPQSPKAGWLSSFTHDYRNRLASLMSYSFARIEASLAIMLLDPFRHLTSQVAEDSSADSNEFNREKSDNRNSNNYNSLNPSLNSYFPAITANELLTIHFTHHDLKRLELYSRNMVDHHMILDMLPTLSKLLFTGRLPGLRFSYLQIAILLSIGLQHRDVDDIARELELPANQILAFFNKTMRKICSFLRELVENDTAKQLPGADDLLRVKKSADNMTSELVSLRGEQDEDEAKFQIAVKQRELIMQTKDLNKHVVVADGEELETALDRGMKRQNQAIPALVSVKKIKTNENHGKTADMKVTNEETDNSDSNVPKSSKKKKNKNKKQDK
eukprot:gene15200-20473_t